MRGEAHVGAVHAEAEGARRADQAAPSRQEVVGDAALPRGPRFRLDAARGAPGERSRVDALRPSQFLGDVRGAERPVHARAEHDPGAEAAVRDETGEQLARAEQVVGSRAEPDAKIEIAARLAGAHARGRAQAQGVLGLGQRPGRRAARERRERGLAVGGAGPVAQARAEGAVSGAPVVSAARGALRLVDRDERDAAGLDGAAQGAAEGAGVEALRRGQRDDQAPGGELGQRAARRLGIVAGQKADAPDARFREAPLLVAQQGAQRRDDESRAGGEQGAELEDQGLARARGQGEDEVAPREQGGEPVRLAGPQRRRREEAPGEGLERAVVADERRGLELEREGLGGLAAVHDPCRAASGLHFAGPGDEQRAALFDGLPGIQPRKLPE